VPEEITLRQPQRRPEHLAQVGDVQRPRTRQLQDAVAAALINRVELREQAFDDGGGEGGHESL
jgi:hypothetical protein